LLFTYDGEGPKPGTVFVRNIQKSKSKYKIPAQRILLETKYLFPLVKGPNIQRFFYDDPGLIVAFPYDDGDPHRPVDQATLKLESPFLLAHYKKYEAQIREQTGYSDTIRAAGEFYGLARTGPYSFADTYVTFRDNTKWRATVITGKLMPWGETRRFLFQNHAVSICEVKDRSRFITPEETFFISGILNTPIVEEFIYASSDNRSFKIRPPVYIPLYKKQDERHKKISQLSRKAHADATKGETARMIIQELYLKICEENPYAKAL
jgi:hypothetical protein